MLCIPIPGPILSAIYDQVTKAAEADLLELRVDLWDAPYLEAMDVLLRQRRAIVTIRNGAHGGAFDGSEEERVALLCRFLDLGATYCDIEWDIEPQLLSKLEAHLGNTKLIASHHGASEISEELLQTMRCACPKATLYKIVQGPADTVGGLKALKLAYKSDDVIAITLGEEGTPARIAGAFLGTPITYASLGDTLSTASGQPRFTEISRRRGDKLFALVGDPIRESVSPEFHNERFKNTRAFYLKMRVDSHQLREFVAESRQLPFGGFSVTMPLKEAICDHLDEVVGTAARVGAVNTVTVREGRYIGSNTDGLGALLAIEKQGALSWEGKKVFIVGAGGTAKAIAYEARLRGAEVTLFNRTFGRAQGAAVELGCQASPLEELSRDYDVMIHATPVGMAPNKGQALIPRRFLRRGAIVLDVVAYPQITPLLLQAKEAGCRVVTGREMFVQQALLQQGAWYDLAR